MKTIFSSAFIAGFSLLVLSPFHANAAAYDFIFHSETSGPDIFGGGEFSDDFTVIGPGVKSVNLCDSAIDSLSGEYVDSISPISPGFVSLEGECVELRDANGALLFRKENLKSEKAPDYSATDGKPRSIPDVNAENRRDEEALEQQNHIDLKCKGSILQAVNQLGRALTPQDAWIQIDPTHTYVVWDGQETDPRFTDCSAKSCASVDVITSDRRDLNEAHVTVQYRQDTCEVISTKGEQLPASI